MTAPRLAALSVVAGADPVAATLGASYSAPNGTLYFATSETTVVTQAGSGQPVVIHKVF